MLLQMAFKWVKSFVDAGLETFSPLLLGPILCEKKRREENIKTREREREREKRGSHSDCFRINIII